jgi:hypothetical protein
MNDIQRQDFIGKVWLNTSIFLHYYRIGAGGQWGAGKQASTFAGTYWIRQHFAGSYFSNKPKSGGLVGFRALDIGGANGIAVHSGIIKRR